MNVRLLPYGDDAVLVELPDLDAVLAYHRALDAAPPAGVVELVPAARTVLVRFDPTRTTAAAMDAALATVAPTASDANGTTTTVTIDVVYDGDDLDDVARLAGLTAAEVVARHTAATYTVAFCGFTPGFGYLVGGDPALRVPRLATPRPRVPAGSVAVADVFSAVYPTATPGGWRLLGRTATPMWDAERVPPALLAPGTRVRFRAVGP